MAILGYAAFARSRSLQVIWGSSRQRGSRVRSDGSRPRCHRYPLWETPIADRWVPAGSALKNRLVGSGLRTWRRLRANRNLITYTAVCTQFPNRRPGLSRWRGGRFACTSLIRRWSLERLAVARYDDVHMDSDVSSISISINNEFLAQLLSIQQLPTQSRFKSHSSTRPPQTPAASSCRKRLGSRFPPPQKSAPRRFRSRLATIREVSRFASIANSTLRLPNDELFTRGAEAGRA